MISMNKETMINYLKDYALIQYYSMKNCDKSFNFLFYKYMNNNGRRDEITNDYYLIMQRVYITYILLRRFSFIEDYLLNKDNFLSENDLLGLKEGCTFLNDDNIINKKLVQLIRDAFNHNDAENFERFKLSFNGKYIQIEFKDIRTPKEKNNGVPIKPLKLKLDTKQLIKILNTIASKKQNLLFTSFEIPENFDIFSDNLDIELDNIVFVHYYFNNKMNRETIEQFCEYSNIKECSKEELLEKSKKLHELAISNGNIAKYHLTSEQKNKLKSIINTYKQYNSKLIEYDPKAFLFYSLYKVIPIPGFKNLIINNQIMLSAEFFSNPDLSINKITDIIANIVNDIETHKSYNENDKSVYNNIKNMDKSFQIKLFLDMLNPDFIQIFPLIIYIDAVVTHYCNDDEICIDDVTYSKNEIRNCLVHGRWFISANDEIVMFDAEPKNIKDYDLKYIGKIKVESFVKWANKYMEKPEKIKIKSLMML